MIGTQAKADVNDVISKIAQSRRQQPDYIVRGDADNRFYAAKWKLGPHRLANECTADHILCYHSEGSAAALKVADGKTLRKQSHPGIVSFVPSSDRAQYALENESTFLEIYLAPTLIERFSEQHSIGGCAVAIRPVFAIDDPWLTGYFRMLESEIEMYRDLSCQLDSLLLGQAQQLLLSHLLRTYSNVAAVRLHELDRSKGGCALRPPLLRRITDYIHTNLAGEIRLRDLAKQVHLSEAHFIRAFHAATGGTPYQYVLEKRLDASARLLRSDPRLSIAAIAKRAGFKSQSHFATKFKSRYGISPRHYRSSTLA